MSNSTRDKAGVAHQAVYLRRRALAPALALDKHQQVHYRADWARAARLQVLIYDDHPRPNGHCRAHAAKDLTTSTIAPIVEDPLEHIHVGVRVDLPEEISGAPHHPITHPARAQEALSIVQHLLSVYQDASCAGAALEDRRQ